MVWLTWRQFRLAGIAAFAALAAMAVLIAITGSHLRDVYDASGAAGCKAPQNCGAPGSSALTSEVPLRQLLGPILVLLPALLGLFWGAPLLARELENGTHRLAWTQSVTRTRWLAVKLALVGVASVAITEAFSLMVTWWSHPIDVFAQDRFNPGVFDERGFVAIGYAAFAFVVGACAGAIIRRTLPAMAATVAAFLAARLVVALLVLPHLISPAHTSVPLSAASNLGFVETPGGVSFVAGAPIIPNAWVYSGRLADASGHTPATATLHSLLERLCPGIGQPPAGGPPGTAQPGNEEAFQSCVSQLSSKFHEVVTYQPASRYWTFQLSEMAIFLALAAGACALCFWWVRRRLA